MFTIKFQRKEIAQTIFQRLTLFRTRDMPPGRTKPLKAGRITDCQPLAIVNGILPHRLGPRIKAFIPNAFFARNAFRGILHILRHPNLVTDLNHFICLGITRINNGRIFINYSREYYGRTAFRLSFARRNFIFQRRRTLFRFFFRIRRRVIPASNQSDRYNDSNSNLRV